MEALRGSTTQNWLIFQFCFLMLKIKLYVYKNLCENFRQIGQKMKNYSLYKLSSCVTRSVYKSVIPHGQSYRLQGGVGVGNGQMYCFFLWKLSTNAVPTEWCNANRYSRTPDLSNTRDFMKGFCAICAPLSWSELGCSERYLNTRLYGTKSR